MTAPPPSPCQLPLVSLSLSLSLSLFLCGILPILLCGGIGVIKYAVSVCVGVSVCVYVCVCLVFLRGNFLPLEAALVLRNFLSGQTALPE